MDGIRAYWDGQRLLSRYGKEFEIPKDFLHNLPCDVALDGELWMGRGKFEQLTSIIKSTEEDWSEIKYYVFDMPHSNATHEERMKQLQHIHLPQQVSTYKVQLLNVLGFSCFSYCLWRKQIFVGTVKLSVTTWRRRTYGQ